MSGLLSSWSFEDIGDQRGKTVIITGANSGIGYYTALHLGLAGAKVILACRNKTKGLEAIEKLRRTVSNATPILGGGGQPLGVSRNSGSNRNKNKKYKKYCTAADSNGSTTENDTNCSGNFELRELDVSNIADVVRFADEFNADERPLHILINNAGIMMPPYSKSVDGFESQMAANYLGHFVLTEKLMPSFRLAAAEQQQKGAAAAGSIHVKCRGLFPRVVSVSSIIAWRALQYEVIDFAKDGSAVSPMSQQQLSYESASGSSYQTKALTTQQPTKSGVGSAVAAVHLSTVTTRGADSSLSLSLSSTGGPSCLFSRTLNTFNNLLTNGPAAAVSAAMRTSTKKGVKPAFSSNSLFSSSSKKSGYNPSEVYAETKLAALLYMKELSRRYPPHALCSVAAHPGVASSNLHQHRFGEFLWAMQSPESGALPILRAAVDANARSGDYFSPRGLGYAGCPNAGILPPAAKDQVYCKSYYDATVAALRPIVETVEKAREKSRGGREGVCQAQQTKVRSLRNGGSTAQQRQEPLLCSKL